MKNTARYWIGCYLTFKDVWKKRNHSQMAITTNFMHIIMFHSSNFIKSSVTNLSVDLITKNDSLCLRK